MRSFTPFTRAWATRPTRTVLSLPIRFSSSVAGHVNTNPVLELQQRGLVAAMTSPELVSHVDAGPTAIYCGVDPTATSLHLGNLVTLLGLLHFHIKGHTTIGLVGGATGTIGDPSGKSTERQPMSAATLAQNVAGIDAQFQRFFERGRAYADSRGYSVQGNGGKVKVVNNKTWFGKLSALDFLGDVGRFARVGTMIARDSVKSRLESPQGISFTEFSYQLLQAYDFWHLFHEDGCRIQLGGSDQWGNITAGIDLIHKKKKTTSEQVIINDNDSTTDKPMHAYGLTIPLLTTSTGEKFGKSAGNAIWLDEKMTSLFDFFQFFVKTTDADVGRYLHYFTLLTADQIKDVMDQHNAEPEKRIAQHTLAKETTELVHGVEAVSKALLATHVLFGSSLDKIKGQELIDAFEHDSRLVTMDAPLVSEMSLDRIMVDSGLCLSKSEAKKLVKSGGFYVNNIKVTDMSYRLADKDWIDGAQFCHQQSPENPSPTAAFFQISCHLSDIIFMHRAPGQDQDASASGNASMSSSNSQQQHNGNNSDTVISVDQAQQLDNGNDNTSNTLPIRKSLAHKESESIQHPIFPPFRADPNSVFRLSGRNYSGDFTPSIRSERLQGAHATRTYASSIRNGYSPSINGHSPLENHQRDVGKPLTIDYVGLDSSITEATLIENETQSTTMFVDNPVENHTKERVGTDTNEHDNRTLSRAASTGLIQESSIPRILSNAVIQTDRGPETPAVFSDLLKDGCFWIDILNPDDFDMQILAKHFHVHPLTIEDISTEEVREKYEVFRHYYFVCFRTFDQDYNSGSYLQPASMYSVFHFCPTTHHMNVLRRIEQLQSHITLTSDWINYALLDDITDIFASPIQTIEYEVDSIDELVLLLRENETTDMLRRIGSCRKNVMSMSRLLANKADVIRGLMKRFDERYAVVPLMSYSATAAYTTTAANAPANGEEGSVIQHHQQRDGEIMLYLGDILDHVLTMLQSLSGYEKILDRSHSNYLAQISLEINQLSNKTNNVVGTLTFFASLIVPMTFITGLWG
ncbi:tyrosyl-tRNA synthetase [Haplosporangium sp. Z 11]|nr:tyrosyl-tRNA synthetase [Haplosporangium sp. Z 11]